MQDTLEKIFNMALEELPTTHLHKFASEQALFYRGFKISKTEDGYYWQDTRYSNYYEIVDPLITDNILKKGFKNTITEVILHTDLDKIVELNREIREVNESIKFWTKKSIDLFHEFKRALSDKVLSQDTAWRCRLEQKYVVERDTFSKRRRVLIDKKNGLKKDLVFFESRIKTFNSNKN